MKNGVFIQPGGAGGGGWSPVDATDDTPGLVTLDQVRSKADQAIEEWGPIKADQSNSTSLPIPFMHGILNIGVDSNGGVINEASLNPS